MEVGPLPRYEAKLTFGKEVFIIMIAVGGMLIMASGLKCTLTVPTDPIVLAERQAIKLG